MAWRFQFVEVIGRGQSAVLIKALVSTLQFNDSDQGMLEVKILREINLKMNS